MVRFILHVYRQDVRKHFYNTCIVSVCMLFIPVHHLYNLVVHTVMFVAYTKITVSQQHYFKVPMHAAHQV